MSSKLVSIVTPCYNGEAFLRDYFTSIMNLQYDAIQLIVVNDGSTDGSHNIIMEYEPRLREVLQDFVYICQDNQGQASALQNALKYVNGKYMMWPDVDDILTPDAVIDKINFLENHPDCGFVMAKASIIEEKTGREIGLLERKNADTSNLFLDYILETDVVFCPGVYMISMDAFRQVNPALKIYCGRGGQNWQILLPMAYYFPCGLINRIQYRYLQRAASHSHSISNYQKSIQMAQEHEKTLLATMDVVFVEENEEKQKYSDIIRKKYLHKRFLLSYSFGNKDWYSDFIEILKHDKASLKEIIRFIICFLHIKKIVDVIR